MQTRTSLIVLSVSILLVTSGASRAGQGYWASNTGQAGLNQQLRETARGLQPLHQHPDASRAVAEGSTPSLAPGMVPGAADGQRALPVRPAATASRASGSFGIPFTSTRVVQVNRRTSVKSNSPAFLSATYPYSAVGRLTFMTGGGPSVCSATLIRRNVIVTAAHCVMAYGSGSWYSNWQFTPGYFRANSTTKPVEPFGVWNWAHVIVPPTWANGTDTGDGDAVNNDLAIIILDKDKRGKFLGDTTGWLGYGYNNYAFVSSPRTGDLAVAQVSTLGYPCLLDNCAIMQRTDGPSYLTTVASALQMWQGSNFTGGSSGGPWIVNFKSQDPAFSGGASPGDEPFPAVIGVTSWGTADPNIAKDNYSSRFGQNLEFPNADYGGYGPGNIGALLQGACSAPSAKNPAFSYQQLGFCG